MRSSDITRFIPPVALIWVLVAGGLFLLNSVEFTPKDPKIIDVFFESEQLDEVVNQRGEIEDGQARQFMYVYVDELIKENGMARDVQLRRFATFLGEEILDRYMTSNGYIEDEALSAYINNTESISSYLVDKRYIRGEWDGIPDMLDQLTSTYITRDGVIITGESENADGISMPAGPRNDAFLNFVLDNGDLAQYVDENGIIQEGQLPDLLDTLISNYIPERATIVNQPLLQIINDNGNLGEYIDANGIVALRQEAAFLNAFFAEFLTPVEVDAAPDEEGGFQRQLLQINDKALLDFLLGNENLARYINDAGQLRESQLDQFTEEFTGLYIDSKPTIENQGLLAIVMQSEELTSLIDEKQQVDDENVQNFAAQLLTGFIVDETAINDPALREFVNLFLYEFIENEQYLENEALREFIMEEANRDMFILRSGQIELNNMDDFMETLVIEFINEDARIENQTLVDIIVSYEDYESDFSELVSPEGQITPGALEDFLDEFQQAFFNRSGYIENDALFEFIRDSDVLSDYIEQRDRVPEDQLAEFQGVFVSSLVDVQYFLEDGEMLALLAEQDTFDSAFTDTGYVAFKDESGEVLPLGQRAAFFNAFRESFMEVRPVVQDQLLVEATEGTVFFDIFEDQLIVERTFIIEGPMLELLRQEPEVRSLVDENGQLLDREQLLIQAIDRNYLLEEYPANEENLITMMDNYLLDFMSIRVVITNQRLLNYVIENETFAEAVKLSGRVEFLNESGEIVREQRAIFLEAFASEYISSDGLILDPVILSLVRDSERLSEYVDTDGQIAEGQQAEFVEAFGQVYIEEETSFNSEPMERFANLLVDDRTRVRKETIAPDLWLLTVSGDPDTLLSINPTRPGGEDGFQLFYLAIVFALIEIGLGLYYRDSDEKLVRPLVRVAGVFLIFWSFFGHEPFWQYMLVQLFPREPTILSTQGSVIQFTADHLVLVMVSSFITVPTGLFVGILVTRENFREFLPLVTNIANFGQTVPTLAILALMVPLIGLGFEPAIVALVLYGLLPVIRNTIAGIEGVDAAIIDAARGMGLTPTQILFQIELAIASRIIMAGIRTSVVINIGTATLGAFVGADGLGIPISSGINAFNKALIFLGAIPAALLAILVDYILGRFEYVITPKGLQIEA